MSSVIARTSQGQFKQETLKTRIRKVIALTSQAGGTVDLAAGRISSGKKLMCSLDDIFKEFGSYEYIKSGSTGHTFKLTKNGTEYAMKIVAYTNKMYGNPQTDDNRPENAEIRMIDLLVSTFVLTKKTPHLILRVNSCYIPLDELVHNDMLKQLRVVKEKSFNEFVTRYENGKFHDEASVLVCEWANGGDLLDYLKNNYNKKLLGAEVVGGVVTDSAAFMLEAWRSILFQIVFNLALIQEQFPAFRHNDFKANNVLVKKIPCVANINLEANRFLYKLDDLEYSVPNTGLRTFMWDFDFACIPGVIDNTKLDNEWATDLNIRPIKNQYYDIHYFFNTLPSEGFFSDTTEKPSVRGDFFKSSFIPQQIKDFVNRVVPEKYRGKSTFVRKGRIICDDEHTTPKKLLQTDELFRPYREKMAQFRTQQRLKCEQRQRAQQRAQLQQRQPHPPPSRTSTRW